jgi:hypothetical protein
MELLPIVLINIIDNYRYSIENYERYQKVMGELSLKIFVVKLRYKKIVKDWRENGYIFPWPINIEEDGWIEFIYAFEDRKIEFSFILTKASQPKKIIISMRENSMNFLNENHQYMNLWFEN